jgi:hypothetical protein
MLEKLTSLQEQQLDTATEMRTLRRLVEKVASDVGSMRSKIFAA